MNTLCVQIIFNRILLFYIQFHHFNHMLYTSNSGFVFWGGQDFSASNFPLAYNFPLATNFLCLFETLWCWITLRGGVQRGQQPPHRKILSQLVQLNAVLDPFFSFFFPFSLPPFFSIFQSFPQQLFSSTLVFFKLFKNVYYWFF